MLQTWRAPVDVCTELMRMAIWLASILITSVAHWFLANCTCGRGARGSGASCHGLARTLTMYIDK